MFVKISHILFKNMFNSPKKYGLIGIFALILNLILTPSASAASLTASTARTTISIDDQLVVSFKLRDSDHPDQPDFSGITKDFNIQGRSESTQTRIVNTHMDTFYQWRLTLIPKHKGMLTIPAITVAQAQSKPIQIKVTGPVKTSANTNADVFMKTSVNQRSVYVQQQVLVTVKLYSKYQWSKKQIEDFPLDNAQVEAVDEKDYVTHINGTAFRVYALTLALYPQKSGKLTIPALKYAVQLQSRNDSIFDDFYGNNNERIRRGRSEPVSIDVKPSPADNTGNWLPAQDITLQQHWSQDPQSLVAGEPVTRSVTIKAKGLTSSQLPPITLNTTEDFSSYKDKPQTQKQPSDKGITSQRTDTIAMVPNKAGNFTLPAIKVKWWNTKTHQYQTARLPAQTLKVAMPAHGSTTTTAKPPAPAQNDVAPVTTNTYKKARDLPRWMLISQAITLLLLLLFIILYWQTHRKNKKSTRKSHNNSDDNQHWKRLKKASADNDLPTLRKHLISWANNYWHNDIRSLDDIARRVTDSDLKDSLRALDKAIYAGDSQEPFEPGKLLQKIQALRIKKRDNPEKIKDLYPD